MAITPYHFQKENTLNKGFQHFNSSRVPCSSESGKGFALLIAVIFMSVMLSFGLALGSLSYKQQILASTAIESQYAFYAADAALECALYADQQENRFAYNPVLTAAVPIMSCDNAEPISVTEPSPHTLEVWVTASRLSFDSGKHCADVTVYKYSAPQPPDGITSYIFAQGYDVPCATVANPSGARFVSRGLNVRY